MPVLAFIAFARTGGFTTSQVEDLTDRCVQQLGGERRPVDDPARWLPNLARRITGNVALPSEDVWLLPPRP